MKSTGAVGGAGGGLGGGGARTRRAHRRVDALHAGAGRRRQRSGAHLRSGIGGRSRWGGSRGPGGRRGFGFAFGAARELAIENVAPGAETRGQRVISGSFERTQE